MKTALFYLNAAIARLDSTALHLPIDSRYRMKVILLRQELEDLVTEIKSEMKK